MNERPKWKLVIVSVCRCTFKHVTHRGDHGTNENDWRASTKYTLQTEEYARQKMMVLNAFSIEIITRLLDLLLGVWESK